jgi:hypothetical protein
MCASMSCQFRRSARIAPDAELHYKEWVIPKSVGRPPQHHFIVTGTLTPE